MMLAGKTSLIIGGDGCIGSELAAYLRTKGEDVLITSRRPGTHAIHLDLLDDLSEWEPPANVGTTYICGARTSLSECLVEPFESTLINVQNTQIVAQKLADTGSFLVFPSTNLVFDGLIPYCDENDRTNPVNAYGQQKAAAERALCSISKDVAIIRMTKVVWPGFPRFQTWLTALKQYKGIEALSDLAFSPVPLPLVVDTMHQLAVAQASGIWHLSGSRDISYWDAAHFIAGQIEADQSLVIPTTIENAGLTAEVESRFTAMNTNKLKREFSFKAPDPWVTIKWCIFENNGKTQYYHNNAEPATCT